MGNKQGKEDAQRNKAIRAVAGPIRARDFHRESEAARLSSSYDSASAPISRIFSGPDIARTENVENVLSTNAATYTESTSRILTARADTSAVTQSSNLWATQTRTACKDLTAIPKPPGRTSISATKAPPINKNNHAQQQIDKVKPVSNTITSKDPFELIHHPPSVKTVGPGPSSHINIRTPPTESTTTHVNDNKFLELSAAELDARFKEEPSIPITLETLPSHTASSGLPLFNFATETTLETCRQDEGATSPLDGNNEYINDSREWLHGLVRNIVQEKRCGFIVPISRLPNDFNQKREVHFSLKNVVGSSLSNGEQVSFVLNPMNKARPTAMRVQSSSPSRHAIKETNDVTNTDDWRNGTVKAIIENKNCGFIQANLALPSEFNQMKDIHFALSKVVGPTLSPGDKVRFVLNQSNKLRPTALAVQSLIIDVTLNEGILPQTELGQELPRSQYGSQEDYSYVSKSSRQRSKPDEMHALTDVDIENEEYDLESHKHSSEKLQLMQQIIKPQLSLSHDTFGRRTTNFFSGTIRSMKGDWGWLVAEEQNIPKMYDVRNGVRFKIPNVRHAQFPLKTGDKLKFKLSDKDPSSPFALSLSLLQCRRRHIHELSKYLNAVNHLIVSEAFSIPNLSQVSEFLVDLLTCPAVWDCLSNVRENCEEYISLLLNFIISTEDNGRHMKQDLCDIFSILISSNLFDPKNGPMKQFLIMRSQQRDECGLIASRKVFYLLLKYVPNKAARIVGLTQQMIDQNEHSFTLNKYLYNCLKETAKSSCSDIADIAWSDLPLIPSNIELLSRPNVDYGILLSVKEVYDSLEEYNDTYFRLLRTDCFSALRKCMRDLFTGELDERDMNVYKNIGISAIQMSTRGNSGLIIALKVTPVRNISNWSTCTNLMYGNLLCISPTGKFEDPIWAVAVNKDAELLKKDSIISIEFCTEHNSMTDAQAVISVLQSNSNVLMVESPTYYGAYKPILAAMQDKSLDQLPFKEEVIFGKPSQSVPRYLEGMDLKAYCLRSSDGVTLDDFQHEAINRTFSQRLAIIQGPPGTGKTFIGVEIVKRILSMPEKPTSPILLVTYKNHALDEFMLKMQGLYPGKVARVGGRSSEKALDECNLNVMMKSRIPDYINIPLRNASAEIEVLLEDIKIIARKLNTSRYLTLSTLAKYLNVHQISSLMSNGNQIDPSMIKTNLSELPTEEGYSTENSSLAKCLLKSFMDWCPKAHVHKTLKTSLRTLAPPMTVLKPTEKKKKIEGSDLDEDDVSKMENERIIGQSPVKPSAVTIVRFEDTPDCALEGITLISASKECTSQLPFVQLMNTEDLYSLNSTDRARLLQCILVLQVTDVGNEFDQLLKQYQELCSKRSDLFDLHKSNILSSMAIVGMTITGANMNRNILSIVKPEIVIVEEAAEVGEPHLASLLGDWVQHLILIGDHQQLRPQVADYFLAKDFHFDISMMERLIKNNVGHTTLHRQSRMHPEISELLLDIYPELCDNTAIVRNRAMINCVARRVFFWDHHDPEKEDRSYSNELEADRAVQLAVFFVQQGNNPDKITILAPYQGQVRLLRNKLKKSRDQWSDLFDNDSSNQKFPIQVQTIDQFQGDENDFIIVSLTRSNQHGNVGFLRLLNRRCVAQSRARCSMIIIGNKNTVTHKSRIWQDLVKKMEQRNCVSSYITLHCPYHNSSEYAACIASDIPLKVPFCHEGCLKMLPCEKHICNRTCQPPHKHNNCPFPCAYVCENNHKCTNICYPKHSHLCSVEIEFSHHFCGHRGRKKCHANPELEICNESVSFSFQSCGHLGTKSCWEKSDNKKCTEPCIKLLQCNHTCNMKCGEPCNDKSCKTCEDINCKEKQDRHLMEEKLINSAKQAAFRDLQRFTKNKYSYEYIQLHGDGKYADEYEEQAQLLRNRIPKGVEWSIQIEEVHRINSPSAWVDWYRGIEHSSDPCKKESVFLRTSSKNVLELEKTQFKIKQDKGDYGIGVYLTSFPCHIDEQSVISDVQSCLIVDCLVGKTKHVKHGSEEVSKLYLNDLKMRNLDSIHTSCVPYGKFTMDEHAVLATSSVLPMYKVNYKVTKLDCFAALEIKALRDGNKDVQTMHITHKREAQGDDPLQTQFAIVQSKFLRMMTSIKNTNIYKQKDMEETNWRITTVDYWINPCLLTKFLFKMDEMKRSAGPDSGQILEVFHGTDGDTDDIFSNNFKMQKLGIGSGDQGFYGAGIYFSEFPQTALRYGKKLLFCRVLPGKSFDISPENLRMGGNLERGYDSHRVNIQEEGHGEEIVIFNSDQILPTCLIHFEKVL